MDTSDCMDVLWQSPSGLNVRFGPLRADVNRGTAIQQHQFSLITVSIFNPVPLAYPDWI